MFFHDLPRVYCMQACPWYKRSLCANNAHQQERGSQTLEETGHSLLSLFLSAISACLHISYSTSASNLRISFCYICSDRLNKANSEQNSHKMNQNVTNGQNFTQSEHSLLLENNPAREAYVGLDVEASR